MKSLNPTHKKVYEFIWKYTSYHGCAPSYEEIMESTGMKTKSHVGKVLLRLETEGKITRQKGKARSIALVGATPGLVPVPVLGEIAAGVPIPAPVDRSEQQFIWENYPSVGVIASELPRLPQGSELFALVVKGDSMIDDGILEGDKVILYRPQSVENSLPNRTTVAAWLVEEETITLKKYLRKPDGSIWLIPANPKFQPREFKNPQRELEIHGVVVYVLRKC